MRLLYCGDVVGRAGRAALAAELPNLRKTLGLDLVVVCGENAAHGFGISIRICEDMLESGVDVVTTGNHVWDQREIIPHLDKQPRLLRPANFPPGTPGNGHVIVEAGRGRKVLVVQVMGRLFMDPLDDPFRAVDDLLKRYPLGATVQGIIVDIHAEATSEKGAMGAFCDGRASLVVGSHSHIPTADARVMRGGTAFQTDAGMCGCYDSVIGMVKEPAIARFIRKMPGERLGPADGEGTLCGTFVETDDRTGLALRCEPVRLGGELAQVIPSV